MKKTNSLLFTAKLHTLLIFHAWSLILGLDSTQNAISCLVGKVDNLSSPFDNTRSSLDHLILSLQDQLSNFSSSVSSLSKLLSDKVINPYPSSKSGPTASSTNTLTLMITQLMLSYLVSLTETNEVTLHTTGKHKGCFL